MYLGMSMAHWVPMDTNSMIHVFAPLGRYDICVSLIPSWVPTMWKPAGIEVSMDFLIYLFFGTNNNFF